MFHYLLNIASAILEAKLNSVPEIAQSSAPPSDSEKTNSEHLQTGDHHPVQHQPVDTTGDTNKVEIADNEVAVAPGCTLLSFQNKYCKYFF